MKKFFKIFNWVLFGLLLSLGIYTLVSFIVNKDGTMYWINYIIDLLNRPLPIIGITTLAILVFVWKIIIATNYGKAQLLKYEKKQQELEQNYNDFIETCNNVLNELNAQTSNYQEQLSKLCALSTNKKIKDFGKELANGKETDSETKTD